MASAFGFEPTIFVYWKHRISKSTSVKSNLNQLVRWCVCELNCSSNTRILLVAICLMVNSYFQHAYLERTKVFFNCNRKHALAKLPCWHLSLSLPCGLNKNRKFWIWFCAVPQMIWIGIWSVATTMIQNQRYFIAYFYIEFFLFCCPKKFCVILSILFFLSSVSLFIYRLICFVCNCIDRFEPI